MKRLPIVLATLLLLAVSPAFAAPDGFVAVICDRDVAPYRALLEGFAKTCTSPIQVIPPKEAGREGSEERLQR
ncbi:MAG TPA: hypothetical protein VN317_04735, partial [Candidatus Methanoperedens sp.]|nr:hypothetical protein [Candidatus Methanoperedens sp.]